MTESFCLHFTLHVLEAVSISSVHVLQRFSSAAVWGIVTMEAELVA